MKTVNKKTGEISAPRYRHSGNYIQTPLGMEHNTDISMCVPDQTMDIRTIYTRFASGRGVDASIRQPVYYGDDIQLPDLRRLDLVEIGQLLETTRENREMLEAQYKNEQEIVNRLEAEKQAKEKQEEDERLLKLYKERESQLQQR